MCAAAHRLDKNGELPALGAASVIFCLPRNVKKCKFIMWKGISGQKRVLPW